MKLIATIIYAFTLVCTSLISLKTFTIFLWTTIDYIIIYIYFYFWHLHPKYSMVGLTNYILPLDYFTYLLQHPEHSHLNEHSYPY